MAEPSTAASRSFCLTCFDQASETVALINTTVDALSDDAETAVKQIASIAEQANGLVTDIRPDLTAIARNGSEISNDTREILAGINEGKGTLGKLVKDDALYRQVREIAAQTQAVMANVRDVTAEARRAIADFRSSDGAAQGLMADMRMTLTQARRRRPISRTTWRR